MARITEVEVAPDENGELHLTREQLGEVEPNTRFRVSAEPVEKTPRFGRKWANLTPEERARDLRELVKTFGKGPGLSNWAVSRDSIYD